MADDLKEIFKNIGQIKSASINYDNTDRSDGTGHVSFENRADASKAVDVYNGAEVNGQIITVKLSTVSEGSSSTGRVSVRRNIGGSSGRDVVMRDDKKFTVRLDGGIKKSNRNPRNPRPTQGSRGGRGGQPRKSSPKNNKTAEELDREMEDYQKMAD
eukprot:TRINITY_DN783_c0_g1_i1.p1 TRINITY_DN783_c0_g1~~TRINITY_DN783_c0_g1_i1.p1  ORF type:complete len:157 (+),score=68.30 TRINITY_DN783_c0_g1_i1:317-787(+)